LIQLLENNKLDTRLRELMIMRIGWVTGSAYEWTQHWRVATTAGVPPEDVLAVRDRRRSELLTPADKAILAATDECLEGKSISDAAWADVVKHVTNPGQQVEFIIAPHEGAESWNEMGSVTAARSTFSPRVTRSASIYATARHVSAEQAPHSISARRI
jgi:3-hydroxyisobutyrate dehydrogenase-like beta-hydroxyacid dehydrogenase